MRTRMEVRCPHPSPEAARVTIQVSSPCYGCPWYVSSGQIHEDLGVPLFADHITALTASFDSKLADVGNPLVRQLGRYLRWPRVDPVAWLWPSRLNESRSALVSRTEVFQWFFLSCKANARVYDAKSKHGPQSPSRARRLHLNAWQKSHTSSLRLSQSGLKIQTAN
jgi:hypothetical protein